MRKKNQFPLHPGFKHNAKIQTDVHQKAFLKATRDIPAGEEIFIDYGFEYWDFFYKDYLKSNSLWIDSSDNIYDEVQMWSGLSKLRSGYCRKVARYCLEITILVESILVLAHRTSKFSELDLCWANSLSSSQEVAFVCGPFVNKDVLNCSWSLGLSSFFYTTLTFLAKYSGLGWE